jgi:hypothetical protein
MYEIGDRFRGTWPGNLGNFMKIVGKHEAYPRYYEVEKTNHPGRVFHFSARIFERSTLISYKKIK